MALEMENEDRPGATMTSTTATAADRLGATMTAHT